MTNNELTAIVIAIRASFLDEALDLIIEFAEDLTLADAAVIMSEAHIIDPTESDAAAEIRDCIRDNTELSF